VQLGAFSGLPRGITDGERIGGQPADRIGHILDRGGDDGRDLAHRRCHGLHTLLQGVLGDFTLTESVSHVLSLMPATRCDKVRRVTPAQAGCSRAPDGTCNDGARG